MRINHNIPALRTLHQMNKTNNKVDKTMQKLSSGLRINSAADDAAGLAISQKMHTQVRGLQQANRNSMDGISLIQTAEGALNEVHDMLQRTRELSIQASNGTLTASDRKAITDEVTQLKAEIDRISEHIEYNEMKLLNGDIDRRKFSDKDTAGKVISMSDTVKAGDYTVNIKSPATQTTVVGDTPKDNLYDKNGKVIKGGLININGENIEIKVGDTEQDVFAKVRDLCDTMGLDVSISGGGTYTKASELIIVHREYGEKDITIKGDVSLLEGLGLDGIQEAAPTTVTGKIPVKNSLYDADDNVQLDDGSFEINGEKVEITKGMSKSDVLAAIKKAVGDAIGVTGDEVDVEQDGDGKVIITTTKGSVSSLDLLAAEGPGAEILNALGLSDASITLRPTTVTGKESTFAADYKLGSDGHDIKIGDVTITTPKGATAQEIIQSIRDEADVKITMTKDGKEVEEYEVGVQLVITANKNGPDEIEIASSTTGVLKGLGLNSITTVPGQISIVGNTPIPLYDESNKVKLEDGSFIINGEIVSITKGMTDEEVFAAIEAVCDEQGIDVSTADGEKYKSGSQLIMAHRENGVEGREIKISADTNAGTEILKGLGLADDSGVKQEVPGVLRGITKGRDVIIDNTSLKGFPEGSTYKVKGNVVTFEANNGFKLGIEAAKAIKDLTTGDFVPGSGMIADELRGDVTFTLLETGPLDLQIGANEGQMMQLRIQNMSTTALGLDDMNLNTADKSQEAIGLVDAAIAQVSSARSKLGAYQNRLEHTVANLDVAAENMTASMSRIQDADMAKEMAEFTKDQILAQAGNAMLAQANQRPQQILQLLQ